MDATRAWLEVLCRNLRSLLTRGPVRWHSRTVSSPSITKLGPKSGGPRSARRRLVGASGNTSWASRSAGSVDQSADRAAMEVRLFIFLEDLARRIEAGEPVDLEQVARENPAWADDIRELVPALQGLAELGLDSEGDAKSQAGDGSTSRAGKTYGDFRIIREIGRGGMGIVYEAEQVELGRRVALKVLPLAASLDPRAIQRFKLEAQVAGWLQHPRIVPVIGVGTVDDVPYYAMQFIEGGSLADLIAELRELIGQGTGPSAASTDRSAPSTLAAGLLSGRFAPPRRELDRSRPAAAPDPAALPASTALDLSIRNWSYLQTIARLGIQAAEALAFAHDQGVIHRDVKPANLLLDHRGDVWVADFGMADVQGDAGLTLTGDLPGTLRYMSPEQALGRRALVDRRTDVYSLGATLYELLTLTPVIAGADRQEILRRIAEEEPAPIRRVNPAVPIDLATIVTKALSKEPSNRYETAWQLADDLRLYLEGKPIAARRVGPASRFWRWCRRRPLLAGLAASLVLSLLFGVAGITWAWRDALRQKRLLVIAEHQTALERDQKEAQRAIAVAAESQAKTEAGKAKTEAGKAKAMNNFFAAQPSRPGLAREQSRGQQGHPSRGPRPRRGPGWLGVPGTTRSRGRHPPRDGRNLPPARRVFQK